MQETRSRSSRLDSPFCTLQAFILGIPMSFTSTFHHYSKSIPRLFALRWSGSRARACHATRTRDTAERRPTDSDADATRRRPGPPALHHVPRRARGAWRVRSVRHCPHAARLPLRRRGRRSARTAVAGPRARVSRRRAASPAAGPRVPIALTIVRLATSFEFGCGTAVGSGSARAGMTSPHPSRDRWAHAAGHTRVTCRSSALHLPFRASRIPAPLASQARVPSSSLALSEVSS
jgi:hypothetical protein